MTSTGCLGCSPLGGPWAIIGPLFIGVTYPDRGGEVIYQARFAVKLDPEQAGGVGFLKNDWIRQGHVITGQ